MTVATPAFVRERLASTALGMWGTSNAVRIPKRVCESVGISTGTRLSVQEGRDEQGAYIIIRPIGDEHKSYGDAPYVSIDELFSGYQGDWHPEEFDWGDDGGAEVVQ